MSEPTPQKLHEIAHKVCLAYGITYTGWPAELVDPAACEGSITWGLEQAFKLGCHVDDAFFKLQASALRLRVEELTHERDQARDSLKATLDRQKPLLESLDEARRELGEARQAPKIELEQETDGRWLAEYKEIPGCMVYGATIGEALRKLADLIQQSEERTFEIT